MLLVVMVILGISDLWVSVIFCDVVFFSVIGWISWFLGVMLSLLRKLWNVVSLLGVGLVIVVVICIWKLSESVNWILVIVLIYVFVLWCVLCSFGVVEFRLICKVSFLGRDFSVCWFCFLNIMLLVRMVVGNCFI